MKKMSVSQAARLFDVESKRITRAVQRALKERRKKPTVLPVRVGSVVRYDTGITPQPGRGRVLGVLKRYGLTDRGRHLVAPLLTIQPLAHHDDVPIDEPFLLDAGYVTQVETWGTTLYSPPTSPNFYCCDPQEYDGIVWEMFNLCYALPAKRQGKHLAGSLNEIVVAILRDLPHLAVPRPISTAKLERAWLKAGSPGGSKMIYVRGKGWVFYVNRAPIKQWLLRNLTRLMFTEMELQVAATRVRDAREADKEDMMRMMEGLRSVREPDFPLDPAILS
jgi:hypothetical protein